MSNKSDIPRCPVCGCVPPDAEGSHDIWRNVVDKIRKLLGRDKLCNVKWQKISQNK